MFASCPKVIAAFPVSNCQSILKSRELKVREEAVLFRMSPRVASPCLETKT